MKETLTTAFKKDIINLPVDSIKYTKTLEEFMVKSKKFNSILASIKEIGIVEPPVVFEQNGTYIVVDGHLRLESMKKLGIKNVDCLLSTDDENFTYNKHINRMASIQEHKMIKKAIEKGVSPEKIAAVLNLDLGSILRKKDLLEGICPEAAEILKDKIVTVTAFEYLRKMKPIRQIEAANFMVESSNYSGKFTRLIWLATPDDQLINPIKRTTCVDTEKISKLEDEIAHLQKEFSIVEEDYGKNVVDLTFIKGYLRRLFTNSKIKYYLQKNYPDIYVQFNEIYELDALE